MERKRPSKEELQDIVNEVSKMIGFAVDDTRALAAHLLQNVNDHMTAGALRALELGDVELACEFLRCRPEKAFFTPAEDEAHTEKVAVLERQLDALRASQKK